MKTIILTERQIKSVIDKIISEQNPKKIVTGVETKTENKSFPRTPLGDLFEYGVYESEKVKNQILSLKPQILEFIKNSDSSSFVVNIMAGESRVTNPKGFEVQGSLALARANSVKNYFEEIFSDLIKNKTLTIISPQSVKDVVIGSTPYGGKGSGDYKDPIKKEKYKKEQFVDFDIVGSGKKTTTTETYKFLCDTQPKRSNGGYLPFDKDYTNIENWQIGRGEGMITLYVDAIYMPDILYFEYDGKTYGKSLFRGSSSDGYRIFIGTALINRFGTSLPEYMAGNTIIPITNNDPRLIGALKDNESGSMRSWGLGEGFKNIYGQGSSLNNPQYMSAFNEFDEKGNVGKLLKTLGPDFKWGYLNSKMLPGTEVGIGPIKKVDGKDTIKIINVAPNGATAWNVGLQCKTS